MVRKAWYGRLQQKGYCSEVYRSAAIKSHTCKPQTSLHSIFIRDELRQDLVLATVVILKRLGAHHTGTQTFGYTEGKRPQTMVIKLSQGFTHLSPPLCVCVCVCVCTYMCVSVPLYA